MTSIDQPLQDEFNTSRDPSSNSNFRKKNSVVLFIVLFLTISVPLIAFFTKSKDQVADIRNQAAYPGEICSPENKYECTNGILYKCIGGKFVENGKCGGTVCSVYSDSKCVQNPFCSKCPMSDAPVGQPWEGECKATGGLGPDDNPICTCSYLACSNPPPLSPTSTPPPGCTNPNGSTHRECVGNTCQTVNNAPGVCDNEDNNTCDSNNQCGGNPPPTETPVPGICQNIKIYKDSVALSDLTRLRPGDNLVIGVTGINATKARLRVNGETFTETSLASSSGEFIFPYIVSTPSATMTFLLEAELYIGGTWR